MGKKYLFAVLLLVSTIGLVSAQTRELVGHVSSSEDGEAVIGASVLVKGFSVGVLTGIDGNFLLERVPEGATSLVVSYMGMITKEVKIQPNLKIVLDPDIKLLDEVVITGIVPMDKRLFTGATDMLSADDVKLDGVPDASRALEGRSAGVSVQNVSGAFGSAPKIRIRGATSIYGNSKPLWVVDGVILEDIFELSPEALASGDANTLIGSAIAGLSPDDIESFQVLKDGSATSIYGARAMAGVIVITTKRGKEGVSSFTYSTEFTSRLKPSYRNFNIMNSQDQIAVYRDMEKAGWLNYPDLANGAESGLYGNMYKLLNQYDPVTNTFSLVNNQQSKIDYLRKAEVLNTDWFDELFNTNLMQNHSLSFSSGTAKSSHYGSLSALIDPGWTKQSRVNRYTMNFNSSYKILDNLTVNIASGGSYRKQRAPGTISQTANPISGIVARSFDINPYSFALNSSRTLNPKEYYTRNYVPFNIHNELENNYLDLNVSDLRFQGELKWKPLRNLEITALGAVKYQSSSQEHHVTEFSNQSLAYRLSNATPTVVRDHNPYLYKDPEDPFAIPVSVLNQGGIYNRGDRNMLSYDFRTTAAYNNVFNENHIFNLFGGMELNAANRHSSSFKGWGMQYSMGEIPFYNYMLFKREIEAGRDYYSMDNTRSRNVAFFSNLTYSWRGKYAFNGTLRYEGSNRLGMTRDSRWLPTWNASFVWNMHEERFFEELRPLFTNLSLKSSYSLTGDRGPAYITNSRVMIKSKTPWRHSTSIKESALYISGLENNQLTYEKKHELNFGLSAGLLENRINLALDWYKRNNFDLIGAVEVQGVGGETRKFGNVASMTSSGFELSLSTVNIKTKDFSWHTDFIYSHTSNKITELFNRSRVFDLLKGGGYAKEGYPVRSIFSIPYKGLNEEGLPMFINEKNDITVDMINFQEREKIAFLKYSGSADPTDVGSLNNSFRYKGFNLSVFLTYSFGNVVRLDPVYKSSYSDSYAMPREFLNRWAKSGDEKVAGVTPVIASKQHEKNYSNLRNAYSAYNYSDARVVSGSFIRLKDISLSYNFPKEKISLFKIENLSLKLQATNLFLLYADKKLRGQDPEFSNAGGVAIPVPKQFTFSLRIGF